MTLPRAPPDRSLPCKGNSSKPCQYVQLNIAQLCLVLTHAEDDSPLILLYDWEKEKICTRYATLSICMGARPATTP